MSLLETVDCASCLYSHHWRQKQKRSVCVREWSFWRSAKYETETYDASGIQCIRYPEPISVSADHGCGEYRARVSDRSGAGGETPRDGSTEGESAAPNGGDAQPQSVPND